MRLRTIAPVMALLSLSVGVALAATPREPEDQQASALATADFWTFAGGEASLRFNTSFLELHRMGVDAPAGSITFREHDAVSSVFPVRRTNGIQFSAADGSLKRFVGGLVQVDGKFALNLPDNSQLQYDGFQVRVNTSNPLRLDIVGNDGRTWLYADHLMWELTADGERFDLRAADLRASPELAQRLEIAELADAYVGELFLTSDLTTRGPGQMGAIEGAGTPNFHNQTVNGITYQADVLMSNYSMSFSRCRSSALSGSCDGAGPDNGEVVFTPSSTLRNTNNENTADIPWYEKFTGATNPWGYPYPNADQHPYLVWNLYRVADGQLEQIAASGVKHAWLTTNGGCSAPFGSHILSRNCSDTYGTGNNDAPDDLGPRSELIPAAGLFGRCGSIFDTDCNGSSNGVSTNGYRDRLIVRESQLANPGAQYYSDSWYVVQDDINIYNTMMHKTIAPAPGGGGWTTGAQGGNVLGPVIDTWVNPQTNPTQNVEIDHPEGHVKIAVKTKQLASCPAGSGLTGTCYRYDYAVNNFDFARAKFGAPPNDQPPNLRVVSNLGFASVSIPTGSTPVFLEAGADFADIDVNAGNNWTGVAGPGGITWTAPAGNELNWGLLFRYSFVTNVAPDPATTAAVSLVVADPSNPTVLTAQLMVPQGDPIFAHDFELP